MSKDSLESYSFDVDKVLHTFNSLFPNRPWKHTSARKAHVDLFGEVIRIGDVYYRRQVSAGWGDVVRLSRLSMERLIYVFFHTNPLLQKIAEEHYEIEFERLSQAHAKYGPFSRFNELVLKEVATETNRQA
jgi:hypothetical protein